MKTKSLIFAVTLPLTTVLTLGQAAPFTKVTTGDLVRDLGPWVGSVWADFDNDGFLDLFVCNGGGGQNGFYHNNGDGTFTKITQGDPVQDSSGDHIGAAAADYDNDGNLDLVVTSGVGAPVALLTTLYHNEGNGRFTRVSGSSISAQPGFFGPCTWADIDRDGFVDLFVANHGDSNDSGGKNRLFKNLGDGTFARITSGQVVTDTSVGYDCLWADYDNDGFPDLLVVNATSNGLNFLYHNNGDGTFTRVVNAITTDHWSEGAVGACWGDFNNDGWLDLFVAGQGGTNNRLYRNNGDGTFTAVPNTPMAARAAGTQTLGGAWGDYDNDGYLDLLITTRYGRNRLFHNNGDATFTEIFVGAPVTDDQTNVGCWVADWVDYDNDGALDLFISRTIFNGTEVPNELYHNSGNTNAWLEIKLVGTVGNAAAIGAKIRIVATVGGQPLTQVRQINDGGRGMPFTAHFGLGNATKADLVRIEWPSGSVQEFPNVPAKQLVTFIEPPRLAASVSQDGPRLSLRAGRGQYQFQSSSNLVDWANLGALTITNHNGQANLTNIALPNSDRRFFRAVSK